jgi:hypothetical protein
MSSLRSYEDVAIVNRCDQRVNVYASLWGRQGLTFSIKKEEAPQLIPEWLNRVDFAPSAVGLVAQPSHLQLFCV